MAVDALIALAADGRLQGDELGATLGKLGELKGMLPLNRLAAALGEAARISPLHRHVAIHVSEGLLASLRPPAPADVHHLLSALREWLVQSGGCPGTNCRGILESIRGGGKTAKLAAVLLKMTGGRAPPRDPLRSHYAAESIVHCGGRMRARRLIHGPKSDEVTRRLRRRIRITARFSKF